MYHCVRVLYYSKHTIKGVITIINFTHTIDMDKIVMPIIDNFAEKLYM